MTRIHARMKTENEQFLAVVNIYKYVLCEDKICIVNMKKEKKRRTLHCLLFRGVIYSRWLHIISNKFA